MRIGLYFGSFNPIHMGHLIIANHIVSHTDLDKVWFVVSPQNPLKPSHTLLNEYHRLHLVELAIQGNANLRASNIEFSLPKPSYTIDTLTYLKEKLPYESFEVIMGSDSFQNLHRWKNYEQLMSQYNIIVYQRPGYAIEDIDELPKNVTVLHAPMLDISSSYIRQLIADGKNIQYLVTDEVAKYIEENKYYKPNKPDSVT